MTTTSDDFTFAKKISQAEYRRRRERLAELMEPNSIAIIPAGKLVTRSRDTEFPFRQSSDFWYLTGFPEYSALMVLIPNRKHGEFILFCRERDEQKELWDGKREGPAGACARYGADDAFPIDDINDILPGLIEGRERIYHSLGKDNRFDKQVMQWVNRIRAKARSGSQPPGEFIDLDHILGDMRLYKSAAELKLMQTAADLSAHAHSQAMIACPTMQNEQELEAQIRYDCARFGAKHQAYHPIVGSGANACTLHYIENDQALKHGDLVLIDAGCEYHHYASDITRTFPVSGKFSREQALIYELVLKAQLAAIKKVKPGNHWDEPHDISVQIITKGLIELGLIDADLNEAIENQLYKEFYMHRIGHWIGLDVHDVGDYKVGGEWRVLEPGMVMTVEPGIYIAADNHNVDKKWRGIGIRIEDDVAVTKTGNKVLTKNVVKGVKEIEALMAKNRQKAAKNTKKVAKLPSVKKARNSRAGGPVARKAQA